MKTSFLSAALVLAVAALGTFASKTGHAAGVAFRADAVQSMPGKGTQTGRIFVSHEGGRFEYEVQGRKVVQLRPTGKPEMIVLIPDQKQYMVVPAPAGGPTLSSGPKAPCKPSAELECRKSGSEKIGDVVTEKWVMKPKAAARPMVIFWDPARKLAIRRVMPDGQVAQMRREGDAVHDKRKVEKWVLVVKTAGGEQQKATMLYDPELDMMVLERHANGFTREIKNIQTGPQDAALFKIPQGYQKTELPRGSRSGAMPPVGGPR